MRKLFLPAVAVAAAVGVVALPSQGATTKPKPRQVAVKDDFFGSKKITIKKGIKVVWTWKGKDLHDVSEASGKFFSGKRRKGTFKHTFKTKGTYHIFCTVHAPDMQMTVKVK
jgi:plastocyanin